MGFFLAGSDDLNIKNYFSGVAFSDDTIVVSTDGLESYVNKGNNVLALSDGRYSLCYRNGSEIIFSTDRTGQDCWFYYCDSGMWIVSNSFYAVAERLKEKKGRVFLKEQGMLFYFVKHSLGEQLYSESTMIDGIKVLPRDSFIKIVNGKLHVFQHPPLNDICSEEGYVFELTKYFGSWRSRLEALLNVVEDGRARCDLSGGIDSRIIAGLTGLGGGNLNVKYSSNKSWERDYCIVSLLSKQYGFNIDNSEISIPRSISAEAALRLYKYGNAGVYKRTYWPKHLNAFPSIHLHGAGGENIRGLGSGSAWKVVHRLKDHFSDVESFERFKEDYLCWFDKNDIDPKCENSTISHYRHFRGRFHFGRNWFRSLTNPLVTPLSSLSMEKMGDFMVAVNRNPRDLHFDMLYLCNDLLPFFPFDEDGKKFDLSTVERSFKYLPKLECSGIEKKVSVFGELSGGVQRAESGVADKHINELAIAEVNYFLSHAEDYQLKKLSTLFATDVGKLQAYGLVKVLELI